MYSESLNVTGPPRKVGIAIDLSNESAYAIQWTVENYLRPGDAVTLVHVRPTSVLQGADWGSFNHSASLAEDEVLGEETVQKKPKEDIDSYTKRKIAELAKPLTDAKVGYKLHLVKDYDMMERLCLEIERLGMSVVIMGSRGVGGSKVDSKGRLGSVSDYCVRHCDCPVVVVRDRDVTNPSGSVAMHPASEEDVVADETGHVSE